MHKKAFFESEFLDAQKLRRSFLLHEDGATKFARFRDAIETRTAIDKQSCDQTGSSIVGKTTGLSFARWYLVWEQDIDSALRKLQTWRREIKLKRAPCL